MAAEILTVRGKQLSLDREPTTKRPLRAWDAADALLIDLLVGEHLDALSISATSRILVVGDRFGALACGLHGFNPVVCMDSAAGREALSRNLAANHLAPIEAHSVLDLAALASAGEAFDVVAIKVPKSTAALVDISHRIRPLLASGSVVVAAGMDKHLAESTTNTLESIIGPTTRHRATKRARHFVTTPNLDMDPGPNPWPKQWRAHGATLENHGGSFSPAKLDSGTGFLLDNVADFVSFADVDAASLRIVDLGCGNGVIGLRAARDAADRDVEAEVLAIDDSALAIACLLYTSDAADE